MVTVTPIATAVEDSSVFFDIARGHVPGVVISKPIGENPDIDSGDGFSDVWPGKSAGSTQKYVAPSGARIHDLESDSTEDAGTVVSSGTATGGTLTTLEDTGATFIADGVAVDDIVLDDTQQILGSVVTVTSETVLTLNAWFDPETGIRTIFVNSGDAYRVVTPAQTGAATVFIRALDSSLLEISEFVVLNGTTTVATVQNMLRINRMRVVGAGSNQGAVGILTATTTGEPVTDVITCAIIDGDNVSLQAIATIPSNKDAFLKDWRGSLSKKTAGVANLRLRLGPINKVSFVEDTISISSTGSSDFTTDMDLTRIPGGTDVRIEADVDTNNMGVSAALNMIFVDV